MTKTNLSRLEERIRRLEKDQAYRSDTPLVIVVPAGSSAEEREAYIAERTTNTAGKHVIVVNFVRADLRNDETWKNDDLELEGGNHAGTA